MRRLLLPGTLLVAAVALGVALSCSPPAGSTHTLGAARLVSSTSKDKTAQLSTGQVLFEQTCASCHGDDAQGSKIAPDLQGVGSATVDLWLSSGWMPLAQPTNEPIRKPPLYDRQQNVDIAKWVASIKPGGVAIPTVDLQGANVAEGQSIFALNCAPCHTITGAGDALSNGLSAPPLHGVTKVMVWEAVRTGPGNMPRFINGTIPANQLKDLDAYVTEDIEHPANIGGLGLGGVGPVAEGFIGLFAGVGLCMIAAMWVGERDKGEQQAGEGEHGPAESAHV